MGWKNIRENCKSFIKIKVVKESLIFLVPSLEQPRVIKRIVEKSEKYRNLQVLAFKRKIHNVNNYSKLLSIDNVQIEIIGEMADKAYFSRFLLYFKLWFHLIINFGFAKKEFYAFGLDMRIISFFCPNKLVTYEISDIIWLYKTGTIKSIIKKIDLFLAKISYKVIFTSEGFYSKYYFHIPNDRVELLENKFQTYGKVKPIDEIKIDKIRIAYIGAFRYENIIKNLIQYCEKNSDVELRFYGDGPKNIISYVKDSTIKSKNIFHFGAFKNPDDLEKIYDENNINFVAYDNNLDNEKVAMPNKFYESGFFNIPIVVSTNTYVGEKVLDFGMGWEIDPTFNGINDFFKNLTLDNIINVHKHIKNLNKSHFIINNNGNN